MVEIKNNYQKYNGEELTNEVVNKNMENIDYLYNNLNEIITNYLLNNDIFKNKVNEIKIELKYKEK